MQVSLRPIISISTIDTLDFGDLFGALFGQGLLDGGAGDQFVFTPQSDAPVPLPTTGQVDVTGPGDATFDIACDIETLLAESPDFFSLGLSVGPGTVGPSTACAGLENPVLSVSSNDPESSVSVGGQLNLPQTAVMFSVQDLEALENEASATFLAIFQ